MSVTVIERPAEKYLEPVTEEELAQLEMLWEVPAMEWDGDDLESEEWVVFVVIGLTFAAALAYAAYCTSKGGHPSISFGWSGFKVACTK